MRTEFIIGIDSSTQSAKAIAWSREGEALGEGRAAIPMSNPGHGLYEQEPEEWWNSFCSALQQLGKQIPLAEARAIAISNQRETVAFLDSTGGSVRPAIVWLDERAESSSYEFSEEFGAERIHRITGKPADVTPVVYRLHWMKQHEPGIFAGAFRIVDVHAYLVQRLTGHSVTSWTSADPMGFFDIREKAWSQEILEYLGLNIARFANTTAPGNPIGPIAGDAVQRTGLRPGTPVIAAGGDGQCAGLGVNAVRPGSAYLNLGTALITGAWAAGPRISREWRTMTSPTGRGYFLEGVLRAGTFLVDWYLENLAKTRAGSDTFRNLEKQAAAIPIGTDGVTVSPYLSGCMNPHWKPDAHAAFVGLRPHHGAAHLYRAVLESLTGEIARTLQAMRGAEIDLSRIVAVGGGANSALWREMIADAAGLPLTVSNSLEASSLGAAITAAVGIGWYPDFDSAADAMVSDHELQQPSGHASRQWRGLLERQDRLNRLLITRG